MIVVSWYRVKNEEKWIKQSIASVLDLSDIVYVFDDNSTDMTYDIVNSFDHNKVKYCASPFKGQPTDEVRDKNFIIKELVQFNPNWFLGIDGDEELEEGGAIRLRDLLGKLISHPACPSSLQIPFYYMWDNENQYRSDGIYGRFYSDRIFKMPHIKEWLEFSHTNASNGFHCGSVPIRCLGSEKFATKVRMKHWGNFSKELRLKKFIWYNLKDKNNEREDRYRHILGAGEGFKYAGETIELKQWEKYLE